VHSDRKRVDALMFRDRVAARGEPMIAERDRVPDGIDLEEVLFGEPELDQPSGQLERVGDPGVTRPRAPGRGALPVLCVVRARGVQHVEDEVLVVSLGRLAPALRVSAGTSPRPRFLARRPLRAERELLSGVASRSVGSGPRYRRTHRRIGGARGSR
jgi:hypothetical protein